MYHVLMYLLLDLSYVPSSVVVTSVSPRLYRLNVHDYYFRSVGKRKSRSPLFQSEEGEVEVWVIFPPGKI